eukprot:12648709-Prorocentrum_lima.AAC.1
MRGSCLGASSDAGTPLSRPNRAAERRRVASYLLDLDQGEVDLNAFDKDGCTVLHRAAAADP